MSYFKKAFLIYKSNFKDPLSIKFKYLIFLVNGK